MLNKKFDIEKEEYLNKLKVVGRFDPEELNSVFELDKFNIYCKYEDACLYINHLAFIHYPVNPIKNVLYIPFIFKRFPVRLGI